MSNSQSEDGHAPIIAFLRRMGYRQTEKILREEAQINSVEGMAFELKNEQDSTVNNPILFPSVIPTVASGGAAQGVLFNEYDSAFNTLRDWVNGSLDLFRDELTLILFPVFVHCFLDLIAKGLVKDAHIFYGKFSGDYIDQHHEELLKLKTLSETNQIRECPTAVVFRMNKYNVVLSGYAFQLLMNFLQDQASGVGSAVLLKIVNQFISIKVIVNKSNAGALPIGGITGTGPEANSATNSTKLNWGAAPVNPNIEAILLQKSKSETRLNEILQTTLSQLKRAYGASQSHVPSGENSNKTSPSPSEIGAEVERLKGLSKRLNLSPSSLPSVCLYTLHNSLDGLTCSSFNENSSMVATGFEDSFIEVWSINHEILQGLRPSTELAAMDLGDCTL